MKKRRVNLSDSVSRIYKSREVSEMEVIISKSEVEQASKTERGSSTTTNV